jgi:hypothetical protein
MARVRVRVRVKVKDRIKIRVRVRVNPILTHIITNTLFPTINQTRRLED